MGAAYCLWYAWGSTSLTLRTWNCWSAHWTSFAVTSVQRMMTRENVSKLRAQENVSPSAEAGRGGWLPISAIIVTVLSGGLQFHFCQAAKFVNNLKRLAIDSDTVSIFSFFSGRQTGASSSWCEYFQVGWVCACVAQLFAEHNLFCRVFRCSNLYISFKSPLT